MFAAGLIGHSATPRGGAGGRLRQLASGPSGPIKGGRLAHFDVSTSYKRGKHGSRPPILSRPPTCFFDPYRPTRRHTLLQRGNDA